jgi:hypothetical protein
MQPNPYLPPLAGQPPIGSESAPSVVLWARLYAIAFAIMYLLCVVGGVALMVLVESVPGARGDEALLQGGILTVVGLPLMVISAIAAFAPRAKWGWILNVAVMGIGCTSCLCLPFAAILIVYWIKPEVKAWYGMT